MKGVSGYNYGVTCPECGHYTEISQFENPNEGIVCGKDYHWHTGENKGCGRTLRVRVDVVEGDGQ